MLRRLDAGRHPDTDSSFWEGYTAPPAPELPTISVPDAYDALQARRMKLVLLVIIGVPMLLSGLAASWWIVRATKARSA